MMKRRVIRVAGGILVAVVAVVAVILIASPREYRAAVQEYRVTDDPRKIVLHASLGPGDVVIGSEVREDLRTVTVIVKARDVSSATGGQGESHFVTVTLRDPLDERTVIDGTDLVGLAGHVVPRAP